jgi:hypothetical protein
VALTGHIVVFISSGLGDIGSQMGRKTLGNPLFFFSFLKVGIWIVRINLNRLQCGGPSHKLKEFFNFFGSCSV